MTILSRRSLVAAGAVAGLPWAQARAQGAYPSQPVRLVVPYAPGGGSDFTGRLIAQKLQETAGFTVIVDNRAGAAGMLGTEVVARAPADGYTLLYADVAHGINPAVYSKARYESAPGVVVYNWYGFLAPAGTPAEATNRLAEHIARILALPDVKEKFDRAFLDAMPQGSVAMARFLDEEVRRWKAVAVQTGISLD
jgi:tripartite-type tricarboxylate transporter receptor subunit TctC